MVGIKECHDELVKIRELLEAQSRPLPFSERLLKMLLTLPSHLHPTINAVFECGFEATAPMVSYKTERRRAVESGYLNQLVTLGHLKKERRGRTVWFYMESKE